ncbi:ESX secretion-associated protein EspG [Actinokineospora bangkokensis]|uniref:ESX secretion-associated protein EspG n=1 Tax=Actinokineospora bangkokensis TaxID=1193682 RepID=A0A1Q9LR04_9PSEU|nr:ESX secretion-associated protein EspG [Actinokineospora bangkokensis]OLR94433.1 hypothetical protein BJP25_11795 [Actinokineospora bangkokensis]
MSTLLGPEAVHLDLVEVDLIAHEAGTRPPFPLVVPSTGHTWELRRQALTAARAALAARNVPEVAADLQEAFRQAQARLVLLDDAGVTGAVASRCAAGAILCAQRDNGPVEARHAESTCELLDLLPPAPAAPVMPIVLPPGAVEAAHLPATEVRHLITDHGAAPDALDRLTDLFAAVTSRGQLRAGTTEISWVDTPTGRVRIDTDAHGWVSVNPLRVDDLRALLNRPADSPLRATMR